MTDDEGPVKNSPCVFPFTHYGKFYKGCTKDRDLAGKYWCWYYKTFFFTIFDTAGETTIIFPLQAGQGLILKFVDAEEKSFITLTPGVPLKLTDIGNISMETGDIAT